MARLTDILEQVKGYHPQADVDLINKAFVYASRQHDGQMRKSGDPYFTHPLSVAGIIANMQLDAASVSAALLHDVVEDCDVTNQEITEVFGEEVAFLVDGVTKLGKVNFASKEDRQAESFRKMIVAMARDIRVLLVKLADRLDNMRTLEHMTSSAQERISRETLEVYAPLASRLGIQWLRAELEDLSFKYLQPDAYETLQNKVSAVAKSTDRYIEEVTQKIRKMLLSRGISVEVAGRRKHLYSLHQKMRRLNVEFDQVHDFVAFRVMVETLSDCYAALGVIHSEWTPIPGRFKDYIALPKPNMYQSLHTGVMGPGHRQVEVQIRTHEMHRTAELGIAAHWQYKAQTGGIDKKDAARFAWLRQLMEFQKDVADPEEFYESVKVDLFPDEVYVFTPKGDVKTLPHGATPVDFAYAVHSEVGHRCAAARVNGAIAPLRHKLKNGDVVEITTRGKQNPSKDWLEFVKTGRARSRIRSYLRGNERERAVKLGRDLIEKEMRKHEISLNKFLKSGKSKAVLERFRLNNTDELFAKVAFGRLQLSDLIEAVSPQEAAVQKLRPSLLEKTMQRVTGGENASSILIDGMSGVLVRYAKCCNPIAGDPVTGWITRGRGVSVHRRGCSRAMQLDPARRISVQWAQRPSVDLPVSLRVMTDDRAGILASVSTVFGDNGVSINEATCVTHDDGRAENIFHFRIGDTEKLRALMRGVSRLKGVLAVDRV